MRKPFLFNGPWGHYGIKDAAGALLERPELKDAGRTAARMQVKAVNEEARTFEGLAATWDQDLGDDVIHRGAFKATLDAWRRSGRVMPLMDQHNYGSVRAVVGKMLEAKETREGLWSKWEVIDGPDGDELLRRLKGKYVDGMSIGYRAKLVEFEETDEARWGQIRHIKELELNEVSVVVFPMNPGARVDLGTVKQLTAGLDREGLLALKAEVDAALAKEAPTPPAAPVQEQPKKDEEPASKAAPQQDEPDISLLDTLRLRRLGHVRSPSLVTVGGTQ